MSGMESHGERAVAEAAEWFTAMQAADVSASERREFSRWLAQSAEHVHCYLQLGTLWTDLARGKLLPEEIERLIDAARRDAVGGNVVNFSQGEGLPRSASAPLGWWRSLAAGVVLALGGSAYWAANHWQQGRHYVTAIGEQTSFTLSDGSTVRLNTRSELRVRFTGGERNIELLRGEGLFEVAKDPSRPFRVKAGASIVQAVGTVFNVYRHDNETTVTVIEGKVLIAAQGGKAPPAEFDSKEQANILSNGKVNKTRNIQLEPVTAWKDRRLVFTGSSLAQVAVEFNRYNATPLRVEGDDLAHFRINAVFSATDPGSLVEFLQRTENVAVRRTADGAQVLYREP